MPKKLLELLVFRLFNPGSFPAVSPTDSSKCNGMLLVNILITLLQTEV